MLRRYPMILALWAPLAPAADWAGRVTAIEAMTVSRAVLFSLSGELKGASRCNEYGMYAIDLSAPGGGALFELLMHAYVHDLEVEAESLNTCAVYWKAEGLKRLVLRKTP